MVSVSGAQRNIQAKKTKRKKICTDRQTDRPGDSSDLPLPPLDNGSGSRRGGGGGVVVVVVGLGRKNSRSL